MSCPCGVDHWDHLAGGFQGIMSMMANLENSGVAPTAVALEKLEKELARLKEQVERLKTK